MTDEEKVQELRERFADKFSVVGRRAFRIALVDPDAVAKFFLSEVRRIDNTTPRKDDT